MDRILSGTFPRWSLCDTTCAKVTPDATGAVDILLGCKTEGID
jgi:hypothetical protein